MGVVLAIIVVAVAAGVAIKRKRFKEGNGLSGTDNQAKMLVSITVKMAKAKRRSGLLSITRDGRVILIVNDVSDMWKSWYMDQFLHFTTEETDFLLSAGTKFDTSGGEQDAITIWNVGKKTGTEIAKNLKEQTTIFSKVSCHRGNSEFYFSE